MSDLADRLEEMIGRAADLEMPMPVVKGLRDSAARLRANERDAAEIVEVLLWLVCRVGKGWELENIGKALDAARRIAGEAES